MKKFILIQFMLVLSGTAIQAQTETIETKDRLINYASRYSAGFLGGDAFSYSFLTHHGINIANNFETTIAFGVENYFSRRYMPLMLDFQYSVLKRNTTPYLHVLGGYLLDIERSGQTSSSQGFNVGGGIGVKRKMNDKMSIYTEIGYRYTRLEREEVYYYWWEISPPTQTIETHSHRLELRVGIGF